MEELEDIELLLLLLELATLEDFFDLEEDEPTLELFEETLDFFDLDFDLVLLTELLFLEPVPRPAILLFDILDDLGATETPLEVALSQEHAEV